MTEKIRRYFSVLIIGILLICAPAAAQKTQPLPELSSKRLLNDLQVTVANTPNFGEGMAIGLVVRYGSYFDPSGKAGVAKLLSRLFLKATIDQTAKDIRDELAYLEASIDVQCDWDGFRFILQAPSSRVERSLLLLYRVVAEAQFNDADFAAEKKILLDNLQKPPDPRQQTRERLEKALLVGTSHARPIEGTEASVSGLTAGDVRFFYNKYLSPNQASLAIVGDVPAQQVLQRATRIWGVWVRKDDIPFTFVQPRRPAGRQIYIEDDPASPAAQFIMGNLFPRREDPAYGSALVAAYIFQERLTKLLPTSLLTVGSAGRRLASPFYVQGQAAAEQAVEQVRNIESAAEEMKASLVSKEELEGARKAVTEEFINQLTTPAGLCGVLMDAELYRLGSNYATTYPDRILRCDADAVRQAAKSYFFPEGEVLIIRGPSAVLRPLLNPLGTILPNPPEF
jgi:zinc protease